MKLEDRCYPIEMILSDVDGVLTDGSISFDNEGVEIKTFNVRDGMGITLWQQAGFRFGILTSRNSHIVQVRAAELGIETVRQGSKLKLPVAQELAQTLNLNLDQICYIGDDLSDIAVIKAVGLGVAVADAAEEVRKSADHMTKTVGGRGAVRELIETVLKSKHRWQDIVSKFG
ncbi:MAG: HAD hydrolase family protein [Planctomycetota bacterium]